jgi:hypothetical protein
MEVSPGLFFAGNGEALDFAALFPRGGTSN